MFRTFIIAAGLAAATMSSAFAQVESQRAIDNPDIVKPFYTDETMTTMKPKEELGPLFKELSEENKAKIAEECKNVDSPRATFCQSFNEANSN